MKKSDLIDWIIIGSVAVFTLLAMGFEVYYQVYWHSLVNTALESLASK